MCALCQHFLSSEVVVLPHLSSINDDDGRWFDNWMFWIPLGLDAVDYSLVYIEPDPMRPKLHTCIYLLRSRRLYLDGLKDCDSRRGRCELYSLFATLNIIA